MCSSKVAPTRPYRKTKRALSEAETRQRIVEATVELHETIGPAKTTIKAIAERAGVQRATVYNHFPDLQTLFGACNAHYYERHPMPDPTSWVGIASPTERLRVALRELYTWYEKTEQMLSVGIRDIDAVPPAAREAFFGYFRHVARSLMTGRRERGRARVRTAAAVGHAISFVTWHSLARDGSLTSEEVAGLMEAMVAAPARSTIVKISASDSPARNLPLEADAQAAKDQPGLVIN